MFVIDYFTGNELKYIVIIIYIQLVAIANLNYLRQFAQKNITALTEAICDEHHSAISSIAFIHYSIYRLLYARSLAGFHLLIHRVTKHYSSFDNKPAAKTF